MENSETLKTVPFRIDYTEPDPKMLEYANQLAVHYAKNEFIITFYRVIPPMLTGNDDEQKMLTPIKAEPVARVLGSALLMKKIVKILQESLESYEHTYGPISE
jgi:hypothetical protein